MKRNFLILLVWLCLAANATFAQTTAFSYQGKLTDAGNPANGNFDLQFKLFDTVTVGAGTQQGATLVRNPVAVSAGVFTVTLDFGANVFSGADRYLEIGVRPAGSANAYTVLAPRQPLTASPYAIQTLNAQQLGGLPASSYLQNTNTPQAGANLNIGGSGTMGSLNVNGPVSLGGVAAPAVAPTGQGRLYFDSTTNKLKVSESGGAFVNLVGATGVSGSGAVNSIPLWSGGTTLGSSLITQSGNTINLPSVAAFAPSATGYQTQIGTPNTETGVTFSGAGGRADIRYSGKLKLVNGSGGIPADTNGIVIDTNGEVGIGTASPFGRLHVVGSGGALPTITVDNSGNGLLATVTNGIAVRGNSENSSGVYGFSLNDFGVIGFSSGAAGIRGEGATGALAGSFIGNVTVTGTLTKGGGAFKIDHPLDPANKYLSHSFVESPDMKNIYDGTVTTDAAGLATVTLPDWFEALNRDFRYQLTVIGQFAQAIVAEEISGNRFTLKTSLPQVKVSWQVTGIRRDAFAEKYRIPVEEAKPANERGAYLHPAAFNRPEEDSVEWRRNPAEMQQSKELREKALRARKDRAAPAPAQPQERNQP